jgi:hypothetical protein
VNKPLKMPGRLKSSFATLRDELLADPKHRTRGARIRQLIGTNRLGRHWIKGEIRA